MQYIKNLNLNDMRVKELIRELERMNPESSVYFRKGRTLCAVTIVRKNSHAESILELTNEENAHIR